MQNEMYDTVATIQEWPFYEHMHHITNIVLSLWICYVEEITEVHHRRFRRKR